MIVKARLFAPLATVLIAMLAFVPAAEARKGQGGHGMSSRGGMSGGKAFGGGSGFKGHGMRGRSFSSGGRRFSGGSVYRRGGVSRRQYGGFVGKPGYRPRAHHHRSKRHRGSRRYYGGSYYYYGSLPYYGDECAWLYRNAVRTGSPYWWARYYDCIDY
jgi:hypothetical protein